MPSKVFTSGEVNEGLGWFRRKSNSHRPPDAVHAADVAWSHLTGQLSQVPRHFLSCRQEVSKGNIII